MCRAPETLADSSSRAGKSGNRLRSSAVRLGELILSANGSVFRWRQSHSGYDGAGAVGGKSHCVPLARPRDTEYSSSTSETSPRMRSFAHLSSPLPLTNRLICSLHIFSLNCSHSSYRDINSCVQSTSASMSTLLSASQPINFCTRPCVACGPDRGFPSACSADATPAE